MLRVIIGRAAASLMVTATTAPAPASFSLSVYGLAGAASLVGGRRVTASMTSRFLKRLAAADLLEVVDPTYKVRERAKLYALSARAKRLLGETTIIQTETPKKSPAGPKTPVGLKAPAGHSSPMRGLPAPRDGNFNGWVMWVTRFYASKDEFIGDLMNTHGGFVRAKEDRLAEAEKAWKAHQHRNPGRHQ